MVRGLDDGGKSAIIGLVVAIGIFTATYYQLVDTTVSLDAPMGAADRAQYDTVARSLGELLLQPGRDWYDGNEAIACVGGHENPSAMTPDAIGRMAGGIAPGRFGLGAEDCAQASSANRAAQLSYAKLANLYTAGMSASPNGRVDYEEARRSLGLPSNDLGFHIRAEPILEGVQSLLSAGPSHAYADAAYIGDYWETTSVSGTPGRTPQYTSGVTDASDHVDVWVNLTNNGTASTFLWVEFEVPLADGTLAATRHSPLLGVDDGHNATLRLWKTKDWEWQTGTTEVSYRILDVDGGMVTGTIDLGAVTMTAQKNHEQKFLEVGSPWYAPGSVATLAYAAYDGQGNLEKFADWTLQVTGSPDEPLGNVKSGSATVVPVTGAYAARLVNDDLDTVWNEDVVNAYLGVPPPFSTQSSTVVAGPETSSLDEARLLEAVISNFTAASYSADFAALALPYDASGDVYPDSAEAIEADLATLLVDDQGTPSPHDDVGSLAFYKVLIVGSEVDHEVLDQPGFSRAVNLWVVAGGTLIVFGSPDQDLRWLQPLWGEGVVTGNGALYAVDQNHPILGSPNTLDYLSYQRVSTWNLASATERFFTHVLRDGPGDGDSDLLAVSNGGSFGLGRVVLSGYQLYNLTSDQATDCLAPIGPDCEAVKFLQNTLTQSYRELLLDYGPPIPEGEASGAWQRIAMVEHPDLATPVAVRINVYVFPT